jgi:hypothetical protein
MASTAKPYQRSWKNILINKRYQLRFTLFMVGTSTLLMLGLGVWVMRVAKSSNAVAANNLYTAMEANCGESRRVGAAPVPWLEPLPMPNPVPALTAPSAADAAPPEAPAAAGADADADRPHDRPIVTIDSTLMPDAVPPAAGGLEASPPRAAGMSAARLAACKQAYDADLAELARRRDHIIYALCATGALLVFGLTLYGLKMTHKVAGPLHKISVYLDKVKQGTYDEVFKLRKHDQLVEFYEHFKLAHAGLRKLQEDDIVRIRAMIEAADRDGLAARSPELAAALDELRAIQATKEKSLA